MDNLTYRELKVELKKCIDNKDKKKEYVIRGIMKDKAKKLLTLKQNQWSLIDSIINDIDADNEEDVLEEDDYTSDEEEYEVMKDKLNEKMMERFSSNIDIAKIRKKKKKYKNEIISPFAK